jgi:hypothetical protein
LLFCHHQIHRGNNKTRFIECHVRPYQVRTIDIVLYMYALSAMVCYIVRFVNVKRTSLMTVISMVRKGKIIYLNLIIIKIYFVVCILILMNSFHLFHKLIHVYKSSSLWALWICLIFAKKYNFYVDSYVSRKSCFALFKILSFKLRQYIIYVC